MGVVLKSFNCGSPNAETSAIYQRIWNSPIDLLNTGAADAKADVHPTRVLVTAGIVVVRVDGYHEICAST
jgi:hypothetical protein